MRELDSETVKDLKVGAILTGRLSEVHVKTLKTAPFVFFDDLAEASVAYNVVTSQEASVPGLGSTVKFTLSFKEPYQADVHHENRIKALVGTVHTLLWPEVEVLIFDDKGTDLQNVKHSS